LVKPATSSMNSNPKTTQIFQKSYRDFTESESVIMGDVSEDEVILDSRVTKDFNKEVKQSRTHLYPHISKHVKKEIDKTRSTNR
jgi:hypothetical protein